MQEVIRHLEEVDPAAAARARHRYSCFDHASADGLGRRGRRPAALSRVVQPDIDLITGCDCTFRAEGFGVLDALRKPAGLNDGGVHVWTGDGGAVPGRSDDRADGLPRMCFFGVDPAAGVVNRGADGAGDRSGEQRDRNGRSHHYRFDPVADADERVSPEGPDGSPSRRPEGEGLHDNSSDIRRRARRDLSRSNLRTFCSRVLSRPPTPVADVPWTAGPAGRTPSRGQW